MPASKIDSKGRTLVPKEIRDKLNLRGGAKLSWVVLGEGFVGVKVGAEEADTNESIINFLRSLSPADVERFDRPDYRPVSKAELWMSALEE